MDRRLSTWRKGESDRRWLSLLVEAMEEAARPEVRAIVPEAAILSALRAQLARPPARYDYVPSGTHH
jgi:hypothetical protein